MNRDIPGGRELAAGGADAVPTVRPAVPEVAEGIIRLRSEYLLSSPLEEEWGTRCSTRLARHLVPRGDARSFVIDSADGGLAAVALALIQEVIAAPSYPEGLSARVQAVVTRPGLRRCGFSRAVLAALLDHLKGEQVTLFELHSSPEAAQLYRELGFAVRR